MKKKVRHTSHKPLIETIINTSALALTSYGVVEITTHGNWLGALSILFGVGLEYVKYIGRLRNIW